MRYSALRTAGAALALACLSASVFAETLTIGLPTNINTLDPHASSTVPTDLSLSSHLYTPLIIRDASLELQPAAAESWEVLDDNTWEFRLRDGITFTNGEVLNAEAVKWNLERVLNPDNNLRLRGFLRLIDEVTVVDPLTVRIHTSSPFPALANQLAMFFLLPPEWATENDPATAALGSGPYELVSFSSGDQAVIRLREDYWGEQPAFEEVTFRIMPEAASRIAAVRAGDVDFVSQFPPSDVEALNGQDGVTAGTIASTRFMFVKFNTLREPFAGNEDLWRALNYAVDRELILDALWGGAGEVGHCQPLSPAYFGFNPELEEYPYDPDRARELLAQAGYPNGLEVELETTIGRYIQAPDIAQIIAAQLGEVGVTVRISEMEFGAWLTKYRKDRNLGDMAYFGLAWPTLDADGLLGFWESTSDQAYYENPEFDALIREARSITDQERRLELYAQATQILCDAPPHIGMFFQPITYATGPNVEWTPRADDWVRVMDMTAK